MAKVVWAEPALSDLDAIGDHIALDNVDAAKKIIRKVFDKVDLLQENPSLGRVPHDLKKTPYRKLIINPVYVYYRIDRDTVVILHVARAERNFDMSRITDAS